LEFSGYEVNHIWGDGGHNGKHATTIFPDALRWLWKDYPTPVVAGKGSRQPLNDILIPGEGWQMVCSGHKSTAGLAVNGKGEVFFVDIPNNRINKISLDGKVSVFVEKRAGVNGLMFGPNGKLYAYEKGRNRVVAYDSQGKETVVVKGAAAQDIAVNQKGEIYFTDPGNRKTWFIDVKGGKHIVDQGLDIPSGIQLTPDQSLLLVADRRGQFVYSFHIQSDGSLTAKQPYFHLHTADGSMQSDAAGMTVDNQGRLYVTTGMGLQICDQAGRVNSIIPKPQRDSLSHVVFGGPDFDELYVTCGGKVFKRKIKAKGVPSWQEPIKPPAPRL
jgi:gluconolactonase